MTRIVVAAIGFGLAALALSSRSSAGKRVVSPIVPIVPRLDPSTVGMRQWLPGVYLKDSSVNVSNLSSELRTALFTTRDVLSALFSGPLVLTSGNDAKHVAGSKHYTNDAVDFRSLHIPTRDRRELVGRAVALAIGAKLKLTGGPPVGSPPLMLWVEEQPGFVPHFHLQVNR